MDTGTGAAGVVQAQLAHHCGSLELARLLLVPVLDARAVVRHRARVRGLCDYNIMGRSELWSTTPPHHGPPDSEAGGHEGVNAKLAACLTMKGSITAALEPLCGGC